MGFRRTSSEMAAIRSVLEQGEFLKGESLTVDFRTHADVVADLLPSELDPLDEPVASIGISRWGGSPVGEFAGASLMLGARHRDRVGRYVLAMYVDTDTALVFGRDLFGEPKRLAAIAFRAELGKVAATVDRGSARLVAVEAVLTEELSSFHRESHAFNVRAQLSPDGVSFTSPPVLMDFVSQTSVRDGHLGDAQLVLGGTVHDPLHEIAVEEVLGASFVRSTTRVSTSPLGEMDPEAFLPLALGRHDFWPALRARTWRTSPGP